MPLNMHTPTAHVRTNVKSIPLRDWTVIFIFKLKKTMGAFGNLLQVFFGNSEHDVSSSKKSEPLSLKDGDYIEVGAFDVIIESIDNNFIHGVIVKQRGFPLTNYCGTTHKFDTQNYKNINHKYN
jgi:hypothetical protein